MKEKFKSIYRIIIGKYLNEIRYRNYIRSHQRFLSEKENHRISILNSSVTLSEGAIVTNKAIINNNRNDKSKISIGKYSNINGNLLLFRNGGEIVMGEYCFLGEFSKIWSAESVIIGNRVLIANNVNIHDNNSHSLDPRLRHNDFLNSFFNAGLESSDLNAQAIIIEDDVWIGFNATIMKGVRIGKGAVVAACSLVLKDVEPNTLVGGNPARVIRKM